MLRFLKYIAVIVFVAIQAPTLYAQQTEITAHDSVRIYRSLELALQNPDKVFRLHLVRQKLREVPAEVFQFKNLRELVLDKNKITVIPDEIAELQNLEVLSCSHNQIDSITPSMLQLKKLTKLDLSDNIIGDIPENIDHLTELEYLILWDNPIYYYPNSLGDLKKLKVLDILNNQLNYSTRDRLLGSLPHAKLIFSPPCNCVDGME
jgi:Leucine-rich repeat (LRR) protein